MTKLELAVILGLNIDMCHEFNGEYKMVPFYIGADDVFYVSAKTSDQAWGLAADRVVFELSCVISERIS